MQIRDRLTFLRAFLHRPISVGSVTPSSRWLARALVDGCDLRNATTVVELGPGTGVLTQVLLDQVGDSTTFFAVEINDTFANRLKKRFPELTVYNESAENLLEQLKRQESSTADYIFSGLPWASLPLSMQNSILEAVGRALKPGGLFITFAYLHARWLPNAVRLRRRLRRQFAEVTTSAPVWRNLPPAFVYRCRR